MNLADGLDRLLVPFRLDEQVPVRARNTYALVDGEHVEGRSAKYLVYRDCQLIGSGAEPSAADRVAAHVAQPGSRGRLGSVCRPRRSRRFRRGCDRSAGRVGRREKYLDRGLSTGRIRLRVG